MRTDDLPHPFADRLALNAWAANKLEGASKNARRFVRAIGDMPEHERTEFLAIAFLFTGDLSDILPPCD